MVPPSGVGNDTVSFVCIAPVSSARERTMLRMLGPSDDRVVSCRHRGADLMSHAARTLPRPRYRLLPAGMALSTALLVAYALPSAQAGKKALGPDDYTKWRSINGQEISGDGKWVAYTLQFTNTPTAEARPALHLLKLESGEDVTVQNGSGGTFSPDSKWIAYQVDPTGGGRGGRGNRGGGGPTTTPPAEGTPPAVAPGGQPGAPATPTAPGAPPAPGGTAPGGGQPGEAGGQNPAATPGQGQGGRNNATSPPTPPRRAELRNLATGAVQSWQDIQNFAF